MNFGLTNKVCVITGGAKGIGLADAFTLGAEGCKIILIDIDKAAGQAAIKELKAKDISAFFYLADASNENQVKEVVKEIENIFQRCDVLVNNAGIGVKPTYLLRDMPVSAWDQMINAHLKSTFLWSRAMIPLMEKNHFGRIINMSSMNFTGGGRAGISHYSAAKAAIAGLTKTLAKEVGGLGITVNAIAPGYVETELIAQFTPEMREILQKQNPVGRTCLPEEVAALVTFLSSIQAAFINGELICMDGGRRDFYWGN
ncbi:SDR family oxidoreductase [Polynucleobacter sp. IMCC30063]|uniref:SDR family NAD(P)-dependent oxidoreductase n=1 Tax=unclassified Polynucleobacter TaxID=2640945 RepID=UPI001F1C323D|nr:MULTISPECIES: SDR family NAD(P)-dependent oxidoreductase [unclassified Polynucleobacter]MCE7505482.1 SDR family oxidoreductase [Polynucleobacter sp. IMCC30063]MCE7530356.1 SDR family oxidoreductase [Polynucleobacter sp. IMCC 29146]